MSVEDKYLLAVVCIVALAIVVPVLIFTFNSLRCV